MYSLIGISKVNDPSEILFDSDVFEVYTEYFIDENNNGFRDLDEEYFDYE